MTFRLHELLVNDLRGKEKAQIGRESRCRVIERDKKKTPEEREIKKQKRERERKEKEKERGNKERLK